MLLKYSILFDIFRYLKIYKTTDSKPDVILCELSAIGYLYKETCDCGEGYILSGLEGGPGCYICNFTDPEHDHCLGIDCGSGSECINQHGAAKCQCLPGFVKNIHGNCTNILDCVGGTPCGQNARCVDDVMVSHCECILGFEGDPTTQCSPGKVIILS